MTREVKGESVASCGGRGVPQWGNRQSGRGYYSNKRSPALSAMSRAGELGGASDAEVRATFSLLPHVTNITRVLAGNQADSKVAIQKAVSELFAGAILIIGNAMVTSPSLLPPLPRPVRWGSSSSSCSVARISCRPGRTLTLAPRNRKLHWRQRNNCYSRRGQRAPLRPHTHSSEGSSSLSVCASLSCSELLLRYKELAVLR